MSNEHTGMIIWVCDHCDIVGVSKFGPDGRELHPPTPEDVARWKHEHALECAGRDKVAN